MPNFNGRGPRGIGILGLGRGRGCGCGKRRLGLGGYVLAIAAGLGLYGLHKKLDRLEDEAEKSKEKPQDSSTSK